MHRRLRSHKNFAERREAAHSIPASAIETGIYLLHATGQIICLPQAVPAILMPARARLYIGRSMYRTLAGILIIRFSF